MLPQTESKMESATELAIEPATQSSPLMAKRSLRMAVCFFPARQSIIQLTWPEALLPGQTTIMTSVSKPAWLDSLMLLGAAASTVPVDCSALMMARSLFWFFRQAKFEKDVVMRTPSACRDKVINRANRILLNHIMTIRKRDNLELILNEGTPAPEFVLCVEFKIRQTITTLELLVYVSVRLLSSQGEENIWGIEDDIAS